MVDEQARLVTHRVDNCPVCGERHDYAVALRRAALIFGGPGSGGTPDQVTVTAVCPKTGQTYETTISVPAHEEFVRIVRPSESGLETLAAGEGADAPAPVGSGASSDGEYDEWVKTSREQGLDFGKTMLTASSGAVAVYFAVLEYLGTSKAARSITGALSVIPPVLFLAATGAFASALRPRLAEVKRIDFPAFREARLRHLNRSIVLGMSLFISALVIAVIVYARAMKL